MKNKKVVLTVIVVAFVVIGLGVGASIFGLAWLSGELRTEISKATTDVVLTSATGDDGGQVVSVPVQYFVQTPDACVNLYDDWDRDALSRRQFEWSSCDYHHNDSERGIVGDVLDENGLPIPVGGVMLANRGINRDGFRRWFNEVDGKSKAYAGTLDFVYDARAGYSSFVSSDFRPFASGNTDGNDGDDKNTSELFTMHFGLPLSFFRGKSGTIEFLADDDTWVFAGDTLVLDMGGVHGPLAATLMIDEAGEVYSAVGEEELAYAGVRLDDDKAALNVFHANRDSDGSVLEVKLENVVLDVVRVELAKSEQDGAAIAYDENAAHMAPLGRSLAKQPDNVRPLLSVIVIQAFSIGIFAMLFLIVIFVAKRYWHRDRNSVE